MQAQFWIEKLEPLDDSKIDEVCLHKLNCFSYSRAATWKRKSDRN